MKNCADALCRGLAPVGHTKEAVQPQVRLGLVEVVANDRIQVSSRSRQIMVGHGWSRPVNNLHGNVTPPTTGNLCTFSPRFDWIFSGKRSIQFLAYKMQDFRNFILHNCIFIFEPTSLVR